MTSKHTTPSSSGMNFLYLTQALCNFAFYGIKSIFVLYAVKQLSLDNSQAIALFATFMSLCYASALIGGTIADKLLGVKNTVLIGNLLSFLGLLWLTFHSPESCFLGLASMSLGVGLLKPNLLVAVGLLFENPTDSQKDRAYSLLYVVMNIGNFLAPLVCGFVYAKYGWTYGVLLIAAGFLMATYFFNQRVYFGVPQELTYKLSLGKILLLLSFLIIILALLYTFLKYHDLFHGLIGLISIGSISYFAQLYLQCTIQERKDVRHIMLCILLFAFFCSLFEQAGSSLLLFFENAVDRSILGIIIPSSALLSLNPLFVFALSPILIFFSKTYFENTASLDGVLKIGIGFGFVGFSFLIFSWSTFQKSSLVSPGWIVGALLVQTIGELMIVSMVLSTISKFAPFRFQSVMMSFWFMAIAYGHYFAGVIAQFSVAIPLESTTNAVEQYSPFFFSLGLMSLGVSVFLLGYRGMKRLKRA